MMKLKLVTSTLLPTPFAEFRLHGFEAPNGKEHVALTLGDVSSDEPVLARVHSECLTGDIFHSTKCECGKQLHQSLSYFQENGGVLLYLRQEGRNIGLINKMKAYNLQKNGKNTVEANLALGLPADGRNFEEGIQILEDLQLKSILLLTNNPEKLAAFEQSSIQLIGRIPIEIKASVHNQNYLETKKMFFNHFLEL